jgi:uncharacterized protein (TIGR02145 family)
MRTIKLFNGKRATTRVAPTCFAALLLFFCTGLHAQVTIGGLTEPQKGAILDLNSDVKGGLLLSNVALPNVSAIPESFPGVTSGNYNTLEVKNNFMGAIVYHTGENNIPAGVYVWNGELWVPFGGNPILYDAQGNDYTIGYFGDAGIWMTQNLRTTNYTYVDGTLTLLVKKSTTSGSDIEPRYTYPGTGDATARETALIANPEQLKAYGLLYNWAAASGRTNNPQNNDADGLGATPGTTHYRGVCPEGWHLPSDNEWGKLEKEIATNPLKYSSEATAYLTELDYGNIYTVMSNYRPGVIDGQLDTYWGRQMKSNTDKEENKVNNNNPNGTSKSREEGGFDALLVGYVDNSGTALSHGSYADFWSSSSYDSRGVYRRLHRDYTGVFRYSNMRYFLFSVRCKKD